MIFVDTGAFFALTVPDDVHHAEAERMRREILAGRHGRMLTSDQVLGESYTILRFRRGVGAVRALVEGIRSSRSLEVVHLSEADHQASLDLMLGHPDKEWSFVDCTSFVLMRALKVSSAFTFDRNFREAGFQMLPEA
ncbi:MAG: type II toxin-antitoxin system VapC family toxin [Euryarchaeota archaeon]|nr:type II toxin-antitoxin system VapC family toxin [Euryarchaeota archaeon]MDE1881823.1 type II toxin-antitoxin system VapC family toxin [Euryarchaeota archaeon]MDE2045650.1 type II toxin-antitoxin system VapC family toxin [Thermoplasmata archaeon]